MSESESSLQHSDGIKIFKCFVIADHNKGDCSAHKFKGAYNLQFDSENISLIEHDTEVQNKVAFWPYHSIRSCGHSNYTLTLDVGRKGSTGEGMFSFLTSEGHRIIKIMALLSKHFNNSSEPKPSNSQGYDFDDLSTGKPIDFCPSTASEPPFEVRSSSRSKPNAIGIDTGNNVRRRSSIVSSSILSKKEMKKQQKEAEKEAKKRDKKEAKENEVRDKEKRKSKKEREKKEKKGKKNALSAENSKSSSQENSQAEEDPYAQANDDFIVSVSNNSTRNKLDNDYTCVDDTVPQRMTSAIISNERQYADPWTDRILCPVAGPTQASAPQITDKGDVYTSCQKRTTVTVKEKQPAMVESYEEYDLQDEETHEIPKRFDDNDESSNNDLYDHVHEPDVVPKSTENIYGMESASAPFSSVKKKDNTSPMSRNLVRQDPVYTDVL